MNNKSGIRSTMNYTPLWILLLLFLMFFIIYVYAFESGRMDGLSSCMTEINKALISNVIDGRALT